MRRLILPLLAVLLLTSKGAAGVTGSGFITLAATLSSIPALPVAGLALLAEGLAEESPDVMLGGIEHRGIVAFDRTLASAMVAPAPSCTR